MKVQIFSHKKEKPVKYIGVYDICPYFDYEKKAIYWQVKMQKRRYGYSYETTREILSDNIKAIKILEIDMTKAENETIRTIANYIETINTMTSNVLWGVTAPQYGTKHKQLRKYINN